MHPLAQRLVDPTSGGLDPVTFPALITALSAGDPVTRQALAHRTGLPLDVLNQHLAAQPDIEYDAAGRIVGHVLTQIPTPHRLRLCDLNLFTWCPLDTLIVPLVLNRTAYIEGACGAAGAPVEFASTPAGPVGPQVDDMFLSLPASSDCGSLRQAFCRNVRFLTDESAARTWEATHPNALTMPLHEAYQLADDVVTALRVPSRELAPLAP